MKIKTEKWCGHDIRFVQKNDEWWAIADDISEAIPSVWISDIDLRMNPDDVIRVDISEDSSKPDMKLCINELGLYDILLTSNCLEARKFRHWSTTVLRKLRKKVGLEGYEIMRMTEPEIQEDIDHILDTLFWDEETGKLMQSVTVQGGDVEQVPFEEIEE